MMEKINDNVIFAFVRETKPRITCQAEGNGTHENRGSGWDGTVCECMSWTQVVGLPLFTKAVEHVAQCCCILKRSENWSL